MGRGEFFTATNLSTHKSHFLIRQILQTKTLTQSDKRAFLRRFTYFLVFQNEKIKKNFSYGLSMYCDLYDSKDRAVLSNRFAIKFEFAVDVEKT